MRTQKYRFIPVLVGIIVFVGLFLSAFLLFKSNTFADSANSDSDDMHFVTIYNQGEKTTIKTDADTVAEALERANIEVQEADNIDPVRETKIDSNNFFINVYHSRPVVVIDGTTKKYIMTSSYDPKTIADDAGLTIYDGDEIELVIDDNFLESGAINTYKITRNGGRTITIEEAIPFDEEVKMDFSMPKGESEIVQVGEEGRKILKYQVNFVDGVETSRELVSEEVTVTPVPRIVKKGAKASISPEQETCANWAREAGVSEGDLSAAIQLIYHESGCRVDAENASGAYGIPQALPGNKMSSKGDDWETNPVTQIRWMEDYVNGRYGGWQEAMNHWWSAGWY